MPGIYYHKLIIGGRKIFNDFTLYIKKEAYSPCPIGTRIMSPLFITGSPVLSTEYGTLQTINNTGKKEGKSERRDEHTAYFFKSR